MVKCKTKKRQGVKEESERERTVKELPQKQRGGEAKKKKEIQLIHASCRLCLLALPVRVIKTTTEAL